MDKIRKGWLTESQVQKLLAAEDDELYWCIWALMADCGLRMEEVRRLIGADIIEGQTPKVAERIRVKGKGDRIRYLELTARVRCGLADITTRPGATIFRKTARAIQLRFKRTAAAAGLQHYLSPHSLRHSFATRLIESGLNIYAVKELMGHSSIVTTEKYLHITAGVIGAARIALDQAAIRVDRVDRQGEIFG